jgi:hypothetical protein
MQVIYFWGSYNIFSSLYSNFFARVINVRPDIVALLREVVLEFWRVNCLFLGLPKIKKKRQD